MPQATAPVPLVLLLTVALGCLRVGLPVLLLIAGMLVAPLFPAAQRGIGVEGIGTNLVAMIFTGGDDAGKQLGCKRLAEDDKEKVGKLAGSNGSGDHSSGGSGSESIRPFCPEAPANPSPHSELVLNVIKRQALIV